VKLKPHSAFSNLAFGWALAVQGRITEGVTVLRQAQQAAPQSLGINVSLGHFLAFACLYDEAAESYSRALALNPQHPEAFRGLGLVNILRGRADEVLQSLNGLSIPNRRAIALLLRGLAYARIGDTAGAQQVLAEAQAIASSEYIRPIHLAAVHAELGELDNAFAWLERSFEEREPMMITLNVHPFFDRLKDDPRFDELLRRVRSGQ